MNKELSPINYFLKLTEGMFPKEDQKSIEENLNSIQEDVPEDVVDDYHFPDYRLKDPEDSRLEDVRKQLLDKYGPHDPDPNWAENRRRELGRPPSEYERARKLVEEQRKEMEKDPEGEMSNVPFDKGGQVLSFIQHLQTGGEALDADTTMEVGNVPMGIVSDPDGAPAPFNGGTGVEDDLDMEVESGSYVLNAEAVQLVGISDINEVIRDAYSIATALGKQMPEDYDPQNKVPIRISNGEAVIPKVLVDIIGLDKLEKWNNKGLDIRKQREEQQAQQPQPQEPQIAAEAPPMQSPDAPMGFNQGSVVSTTNLGDSDRNKALLNKFRERVQGLPPQQPSSDLFEERLPPQQPSSALFDIPFDADEEHRSEPYEEGTAGGILPPKAKPKKTDPYNAKFGTGTIIDTLYTPTQKIETMTLSQVLSNQIAQEEAIKTYNLTAKKKQHESGAWGAYQIMPSTLRDLMKKKQFDPETIFNKNTQDNLAKELLRRRKVYDYIKNPKSPNLSTIQNNLAKEWRSLPNTAGVSESADSGQKIGIGKQEFRDILKRVQELGPKKGVELLLKTIIEAEHTPRKNLKYTR